jgi:hypothetical protein
MAIIYPWYLPPVAVLGAVLIPQGAFAIARASRWSARATSFAAIGLLAMVVTERVYLFLQTCQHAVVGQELIEMGNRARVGFWLKERIGHGGNNRVYLEPIGYVGYFSEANILDWPGLITPEVVQLRRDGGRGFYSLPEILYPDWVVLRPREAKEMVQQAFFRDNYVLEREFDVSSELRCRDDLPGKDTLLYDAIFLVYRKVIP